MRVRSTAEWTTFAVATAIVLGVLVLILVQIPSSDRPADPVARAEGAPTRIRTGYVVPVVVQNRGGATAENVQVLAELEVGGKSYEADQVVDFLSGGESVDLRFVFPEDPENGEIAVRIGGYTVP